MIEETSLAAAKRFDDRLSAIRDKVNADIDAIQRRRHLLPIDKADVSTLNSHLRESDMNVVGLTTGSAVDKSASASSVHNGRTSSGPFQGKNWNDQASTLSGNIYWPSPSPGAFSRHFGVNNSPVLTHSHPHELGTDALSKEKAADDAYFHLKFPTASPGSSRPISPLDVYVMPKSMSSAPWRHETTSPKPTGDVTKLLIDNAQSHSTSQTTIGEPISRSIIVVDTPPIAASFGSSDKRLITTGIGYLTINNGIFMGRMVNGGLTTPMEGIIPPKSYSIDKLHAELRNIDVTSKQPGSTIAPIVNEAIKKAPKNSRNLQVRTFAEQRRQIKTSVCDLELPIYGPLTVSNIKEHEKILTKYLKNVTHGSHLTLSDSENDPLNTTQQRESTEEGFVDEHGNVVISKKVTRIVTTTKTTYDGDGQPHVETQQTFETTGGGDEAVPDVGQRSVSPSSLRRDASDAFIRLKVNRDVYDGELEGNQHIKLTKYDK